MTTPAQGEIACPDPSVHHHKNRQAQDASSAALLAASQHSKSNSQQDNVLTDDGKLSSRSAATSLKHAKAQDLPSFPSRGGTSDAAQAAATLAKDHRMKDLWQPESSVAGSKAAMLAAKDGGHVELWYPSPTSAGNSAATLAMRNKGLSPQLDLGYTDAGRSNSMLAAKKSDSLGRQRAGSTPVAPAPTYPDSHNSTRNALNAATVSHRKMAPDGWDSEAMQAARFKNIGTRMDREMFGEHPPVEPELEEQRHDAALRASAVSMAKRMYEHQQRTGTPSDNSSNIGSADAGAQTAHRRNQSSTSTPGLKEEAIKYIHLQDAAHKMAQERLAKLDKDMEADRYREYYGYGNQSPKKSRLSGARRGRKRASSEGQYEGSSDEEQARTIRTQMSQLSSAQKTVDDKQRQDDRAKLLAAAERRVQARMHDMDEKVFMDTGHVSQTMMDEWEIKAREKAEQDKVERERTTGKTHIGGGKYMDKSEIEAIAAARLKPTLDEINATAEKLRQRDADLQRQADERDTARMQEKIDAGHKKEEEQQRRNEEAVLVQQRRREEEQRKADERAKDQAQKTEFKRIREQDKAAAKKEKEDRKAAERREKEEAKSRKAEDKRKSRETKRDEVAVVAGGGALGEVAEKVKDDKAREEKEYQEAAVAGGDALHEVAEKVKTDREAEEERKEQEAREKHGTAVAGGATLGEVAEKVRKDNKAERAQASRDAETSQTTDVAGESAFAQVVGQDDEVERRPEDEEHHYARDAATVGGVAGVAGAGTYEAIERRNTGPASKTIGPHESNIANILDPRVKPDPALQKEEQPLTSGPYKSDIANIVDPRVDSDKTPDQETRTTSAGATSRETPGSTKETRELPKEKRGLFGRFLSRSKKPAADEKAAVAPERDTVPEKTTEEPDQPDEGAGVAAVPVLGAGFAASGGGDEELAPKEDEEVPRNEERTAAPTLPALNLGEGLVTSTSVPAQHATEADVDDDEDLYADGNDERPVDRSRTTEALIGASGVVGAGFAAAIASTRGRQRDEEEVSDLSTEEGDEIQPLEQYTTAEHSGHHTFATSSSAAAERRTRPDLERHISALETSSDSDGDDELEDSDDEFDFEDRAGIGRVGDDAPGAKDSIETERAGGESRFNTIVAQSGIIDIGRSEGRTETGVPRSESPVSPLGPEDGSILADQDVSPSAPRAVTTQTQPAQDSSVASPVVRTGPQEEKGTPSRDDKERGGIRGLLHKLTSKPENKLHKRQSPDDGITTESAKSEKSFEGGAKYTGTTERDEIVTPVTTTTAGLAETGQVTDNTTATSQPVIATGPTARDASPSSFTRHEDAPKDIDDVSSSGAEEGEVERGRTGRIAEKIGFRRDKGKAEASDGTEGPVSGVERSETGEEDQFEEARDHFDESLAPPPAFAGQAKNDGQSPVRETRFQEQF